MGPIPAMYGPITSTSMYIASVTATIAVETLQRKDTDHKIQEVNMRSISLRYNIHHCGMADDCLNGTVYHFDGCLHLIWDWRSLLCAYFYNNKGTGSFQEQALPLGSLYKTPSYGTSKFFLCWKTLEHQEQTYCLPECTFICSL